MKLRVLALLWLLPIGAMAQGGLSGRVATQGGLAIERARVVVEGQSAAAGGPLAAWTDSDGRFVVEARVPCRLVVSHPRFLTVSKDVASAANLTIEIQLEPKMEIFEHVSVTAGRAAASRLPPPMHRRSIRTIGRRRQRRSRTS